MSKIKQVFNDLNSLTYDFEEVMEETGLSRRDLNIIIIKERIEVIIFKGRALISLPDFLRLTKMYNDKSN